MYLRDSVEVLSSTTRLAQVRIAFPNHFHNKSVQTGPFLSPPKCKRHTFPAFTRPYVRGGFCFQDEKVAWNEGNQDLPRSLVEYLELFLNKTCYNSDQLHLCCSSVTCRAAEHYYR